jgi:hypothetical protein
MNMTLPNIPPIDSLIPFSLGADVGSFGTVLGIALGLGTIFYGTTFLNNGINCFAIEDLYFYKGKNYVNDDYLTKMNILKHILHLEMSQTALTNKFTIFGLPLVSNDFNLLLNEIELLPYKVSQIKFRFFDKKTILFMNYFKPVSNYIKTNSNNIINKAIFMVTADIQPDIYNLFMYKNGKEEYYDIAHIPDFKTSAMMNKLFRNIKENDNLDRLEESDDEDEDQNQGHTGGGEEFHHSFGSQWHVWENGQKGARTDHRLDDAQQQRGQSHGRPAPPCRPHGRLREGKAGRERGGDKAQDAGEGRGDQLDGHVTVRRSGEAIASG